MIEDLMKELATAKTVDEILSYESKVLELYNSLSNRISNKVYSITDYNNIKGLYDLEDSIYTNFKDSKYFFAIERILGAYRIRFTKMKYILEYQPMFVKVAYTYLHSILY